MMDPIAVSVCRMLARKHFVRACAQEAAFRNAALQEIALRKAAQLELSRKQSQAFLEVRVNCRHACVGFETCGGTGCVEWEN